MTTTAPGLRTVKPSQGTPRQVSRESRESRESHISQVSQVSQRAQESNAFDVSDESDENDVIDVSDPLDDDPTEYPDWEPLGRDINESLIVRNLEPVIIRHQAQRGIVCCVGSDNFIYWVKGNNQMSVSPDIYILPGLAHNSRPRSYPGSKDEGCWKTWIHGVVPNFALEVKAWRKPRKDELQAPERHDALGTKELIVFDPFHHRRRKPRKRFVVYRRDASGKHVIVQATNDDRVYSEELDAFLVAQGVGEEALLRLGLGPNGERLVPFETELVDMHAQRADHEARRAEEAARRAEEATRAAEEIARQNAELAAEIARLRAEASTRGKR